MTAYYTLKGTEKGEYKEKGSKFLAFGCRINNENEAKNFIESITKEHHKARHVCYAYRIGTEDIIKRSSDAGEPTYTAGIPILKQILKYDLTNVIVVVVRYFGGVLLGKGGLITAYGKATETTIKNAEKIEYTEMIDLCIEISFDDYPKVMDFLKKNDIKVSDQRFDNSCYLDLEIPKKLKQNIFRQLPESKIIGIKQKMSGK